MAAPVSIVLRVGIFIIIGPRGQARTLTFKPLGVIELSVSEFTQLSPGPSYARNNRSLVCEEPQQRRKVIDKRPLEWNCRSVIHFVERSPATFRLGARRSDLCRRPILISN